MSYYLLISTLLASTLVTVIFNTGFSYSRVETSGHIKAEEACLKSNGIPHYDGWTANFTGCDWKGK